MRSLPLIVGSIVLASCGTTQSTDYVSMSGGELYRRFCASCHGLQGAGDGVLSSYFIIEIPNLQELAVRAGGRYPKESVIRIIDGRDVIAGHGTPLMPVWGEELGGGYPRNQQGTKTTQLLIERLADHVCRLQKPALNGACDAIASNRSAPEDSPELAVSGGGDANNGSPGLSR